MLDLRFIRENLDYVKKRIQERGVIIDFDKLLTIDEERRKVKKGWRA
jgi:seryl-tRNA synthetase